MLRRVFARALYLVFASLLAAAAIGENNVPVTFDIAPNPKWVKPIEAEMPASPREDNSGVSYLLIDQQENIDASASYYHEVRQVTSDTGVQNESSLAASFDPTFQRLAFHSIRVIRGGVATNRLQHDTVQLLRREREMEKFLYDGSYTAQAELDDIRIGDIVEFAYTITGANPVLKGKYCDRFRTQWRFPVQRSVLRFLHETQRRLTFKTLSRDLHPSIRTDKSVTEWLSDERDVPGKKIANDAPDDYHPRGSLQVSEFGTSREVVNWALPMFGPALPATAEFREYAEKLRAIANDEEKVLAALHFVQNEVRYLGLESGIGSHQPTAPGEVMRRRFGDCKDKALLLTTLLRSVGIDAAPALVSTDFGKAVHDRLPAPDDFDHAIVQVRLGDTTHWLDPTRTQQRGPLSEVYVEQFGYALVLREGSDALTDYAAPPEALPRRKVSERYRIAAPEGAAELTVHTELHGLAADLARSDFADSNRDEIQKQYLQYYAKRYPSIEARGLPVFRETPGGNSCSIDESYRIPKIWELDREQKRYRIELRPSETPHEASPTVEHRDDPLAIRYPQNLVCEMQVEMFDDWPMEPSGQEIDTPSLRYHDEAHSKGRELTFLYTYESLTDRVSPQDMPKHNAAIEKINDSLGYTLTYRTPEQLRSDARKGRINWTTAALLVAVFITAAVLSFIYLRATKRAAILPLPSEAALAPSGLSGWLLLVGLQQIARPLAFIATTTQVGSSVLNRDTWQQLTSPGTSTYHPLWEPSLLFELIYGASGFVLAVLLLILFFKKRAAWPKTYATFLLVNVFAAALDAYLCQGIPATRTNSIHAFSGVTQSAVAAAIWIPYTLVSSRVKATFRN